MCGKKAIFMRPIYVNRRKREPVTKGVHFFNTVKHRIEETAHASLDDGFQFSQHVGLS